MQNLHLVAARGIADRHFGQFRDQPDAPGGRVSLEECIAIAKKARIPLLVDAAAELPPVQNLSGYTKMGADLVAFSGGKAIGGPQGSGILAGKRDLIMAAVLFNMFYTKQVQSLVAVGFIALGAVVYGLVFARRRTGERENAAAAASAAD